ncbi:ARM repeat-containing protein [Pleurotus eryngii]|uniref:ARM repeat-containing protein n=1 Tax=Pleurotus eryngii TaxID=5323 RepID=A0A9P6A213_PLEER|nr:ARM repeat-containing protein [Pleurotus eryngii]
MTKSDIQSWVASAEAPQELDGSDDSWQRDRVLNEWPWAMQTAHQRLATSKTRPRIRFLKEELLFLAKHADLNLSQTLDIFKLLTETYAKYSDSSSRDAVEDVGRELVRRDEARGTPDGPADESKMGVAEQVLAWMKLEVNRIVKAGSSSHASSSVFVLLSWTCGLYTAILKANPEFTVTHCWSDLVGCMALLLDTIQDSSHTKKSLLHSALVRVRRAIRSAPEKIPELIDTLISHARASLRHIPLLGTSIDVLIRLKNVKELPFERLSAERKSSILNLYTTSILMSKSPVPSHVVNACHDFIQHFVTAEDLSTLVIPTIEKALLRSPEISLIVISQFFDAYSHPLSSEDFRRALVPTLNSSKSSNALVRGNAIGLFKALITDELEESSSSLAAAELLSLPKTGKSSGPDHRAALYSMLSYLQPSIAVSSTLIKDATPLLAKETNDTAISTLAAALPPHLSFLLSKNQDLPSEITTLIAKEMNNTKPVIRHAFCSLAGASLMAISGLDTDAGLAFAAVLLPAFESNLKAVASNPLNASGGPLEGYIALSCLLGPIRSCTKFTESISKITAIQSLFASTVKPSFLLWDKVYQKASDPAEEKWLLTALSAAIPVFNKELTKFEVFRVQAGLLFIHLAVNSGSPESRRNVLTTLSSLSSQFAKLTNDILYDALVSFLANGKTVAKASCPEGPDGTWNKHSRLSTLLLSCFNFSEDVDATLREDILVQVLVVAHHEHVCEPSRQIWVELCQKANVDPFKLVNGNVDRLMKNILAASTIPAKLGFSEASYRSAATLAFIAPSTVVPRVVDQLKVDLDPSTVNGLTDMDLGVWSTPEGVPFVDVLASKKDDAPVRKGKEAKMAQWEADVRKSLANKKPANGVLSKQDQAAIQAQLEKEQDIRQKVFAVKANLERGLRFIQSLVASNTDEFKFHLSTIAALLVDGALRKGDVLVSKAPFDTYISLAKCCSDRLGVTKEWVGIATLRALDIPAVPEDLQAEPADSLVLRVLYRLRALSEQAPFDAATFSYAFPLLHQVLIRGGINATEGDSALEQVKLALDIIRFHCAEFGDAAYPRKMMIQDLLHIIKQQPKLAKEASSTLIDLGESILTNVSDVELDSFIKGTLVQEPHIRNACLSALQPFDLTDLDWSPELWIACHDDDEQNSRLARHLWEDNGLDVPEAFLSHLLEYLGHEHSYVRNSAAAAITEAVETWPQSLLTSVSVLQDYYRDRAKVLAPEYDEYGMVIARSLEQSDPWPARLAAARTFALLAPLFTSEAVIPFFEFLIKDEALADKVAEVRREILGSGIAVIDAHGASKLAGLIAMFEAHLAAPTPPTEAGDQIKEAVVILFGRVARHLQPTDPRIPLIVSRLVDALKTPAEQVQIAVSDCLVPLVKLMGDNVSKLVDTLFNELFTASKYAARRGAAYGLAGVIKGIGIGGMKEHNVLIRLRTATEEKKQYEHRQGAMFAFETLSTTLGRNFEPYITFVLPLLLSAFGDSTSDVREAAQDAARVIMSNLSGYGLKLILPSLLAGLEEKQWRTKKGSIELLGMMAYCSPRQLSLSLPIVIPQLTSVLTDSHAQVKSSANKSLKQFGEVISNPEIQSLAPILLKAMVDPVKISNALSSLLKTSFMHYIDQSSLALVVPILERGLRERSAETKKKAAQITGNLASLTDAKDFVPYLNTLLPLVHTVLVDPVPEARATAAKALGTLVERLGETHFPDLVPGLLRILKTDTSGVDRQGAAQGLSEVLSGLGMERLEGLLPDIIANAQSPRPTVREGFMSLLVFLPATFGSRFQPHLPRIIAPILSGISDREDYVREAAMRAGRMVVTNYSHKAIDLLLPELEQGMFDPGWRIRQSSITLVGELLFKVSGISGKTEVDDEEVAATTVADSSRKALVEVLGAERRDRILSSLYLVRQDSVMVVRQSSIHIWKALVFNTPRTVREILPDLVTQIIRLISGDEPEQQEIAARTTTEICRKSGEKIMGEIITALKSKSSSSDSRTREGVCLMLCELMESSSEGQRDSYEDEIITMVRISLVDEEANVRAAAAKAFDILQEFIGAKAIDATIPTLLEALRQPGQSSGTALQALREVMSVRASTVFPVLIPTLTAIPMSVFNARALASLVTVAGDALSKRLTPIMNAVTKAMEDGGEDELVNAVDEAIEALMGAIEDAEGLNTLMMILLGWAKHDSPVRRASAYKLFAVFCEATELDASLYRVDWIRQLVSGLEEKDSAIYTAAWSAFDIFVKSTPKDELEPLVVPLRRSIESCGPPGYHVPGFSIPKGVAPMVPIIIAGLTAGSNEQRENAAYAIGDLVERTEESAIKPFVVPFTGPLIRVATQATTYPPAVKTGLLSALMSMLQRIPAFVKPFFPQLQRTFVKSAGDPASVIVRNKAAQALGVLMRHQPRVDPVVTELISSAKGADDAIASSLVLSLAYVIRNASANIGDKAREASVELVAEAFRDNHDDHYTQSIATLFKSLGVYERLLEPIVKSNLCSGTPPSVLSSRIILTVLSSDDDDVTSSPNIFQKLGILRSVAQKVQESMGNEKSSIARPAREARDLLKDLEDDDLRGLF